MCPMATPVSDERATVVGFSFAIPALPVHLMATFPDVVNGEPKTAPHLLVINDHEPFPFPVKVEVVTLLDPSSLQPPSASFTLTDTDDPPTLVSPGENLSDPVAVLQETVPVPSTGGPPADAVPTLASVTVATGNAITRAKRRSAVTYNRPSAVPTYLPPVRNLSSVLSSPTTQESLRKTH
jgi:hypothetical protein